MIDSNGPFEIYVVRDIYSGHVDDNWVGIQFGEGRFLGFAVNNNDSASLFVEDQQPLLIENNLEKVKIGTLETILKLLLEKYVEEEEKKNNA